MTSKAALVIGAGPGVSASVARRWAREGYAVGLVGRDPEVLGALAAELAEVGVRAAVAQVDLADESATRAAVVGLADELGRVDLLHFNPSAYRERSPLELGVEELLEDVRLGVGALLPALQAARPAMPPGARVTVTGSMAADQPSAAAASLGVQKAGVRNLVDSIDQVLAPEGIRAVSVTVRGLLAREGAFSPERVAEAIWAAAHQPEDAWATEVPYSG